MEKNDLYKVIEQNGIVCNFEELKPIQVIGRIKAICNAYKVDISDSTLKYFIESCGTNMQELINEIRKLIEYAGENGTITKEAINLLSINLLILLLKDLLSKLKNILPTLFLYNGFT